jgi:hypothetical protein
VRASLTEPVNSRLLLSSWLAFLCACGARSDLTCLGGVCSGPETGIDPGGAGGSQSGEVPVRNDPPPDYDPGVMAPPSPRPVRPPPDEPLRRCERGDTVGDTNVSSYEELEELEGCERVNGSLTLSGFQAPDLLPLARLRVVTGVLELGVDGPLTGLESLESVGSLVLSNITASSLAPLGNLTDISAGREGYISISFAHSLSNLTGLGSALTSGRIEIRDNPRLTSLAGLRFPQGLEELSIANTPELADLAEASNLRSVRRLVLTNTSLRSLQGLSGLTEAFEVVLIDNTLLSDVGGLGGLAELSLLRLSNSALVSLDGLSNVSRIDVLRIDTNPLLEQLDGLSHVVFSELSVQANSSLTQLPTFAAVTELDTLELEGNPVLVNGPDLPNVTRVDRVRIVENAVLESISALRSMRITRNIVIRQNPTLTALDLSSLETFRSLRVFCNTALSEAALEPFRDSGAGVVTSFGNSDSLEPCLLSSAGASGEQ